jgi:hypothetical protein
VSGENGAINVRRIWMDILKPIGKFKLGRQPSNWGLGIFKMTVKADRLILATQQTASCTFFNRY